MQKFEKSSTKISINCASLRKMKKKRCSFNSMSRKCLFFAFLAYEGDFKLLAWPAVESMLVVQVCALLSNAAHVRVQRG